MIKTLWQWFMVFAMRCSAEHRERERESLSVIALILFFLICVQWNFFKWKCQSVAVELTLFLYLFAPQWLCDRLSQVWLIFDINTHRTLTLIWLRSGRSATCVRNGRLRLFSQHLYKNRFRNTFYQNRQFIDMHLTEVICSNSYLISFARFPSGNQMIYISSMLSCRLSAILISMRFSVVRKIVLNGLVLCQTAHNDAHRQTASECHWMSPKTFKPALKDNAINSLLA